MAQKAFIGGFASSKHQVNWVAEKLSDHYDEEVDGISFVDALRDPELTAEKINGLKVVTHSAGYLALRNTLQYEPLAAPSEVEAFGPPVPTPGFVLIARSHRIAQNLIRSSARDLSSAKSDVLHAYYLANEIRSHAIGNIGAIPRISRFDSFDFAQQSVSEGIPTGLRFMVSDEFFHPHFAHIEAAREAGVDVALIKGNHPDFVRNPISVLQRLAIAKALPSLMEESPLQFEAPIVPQTLAV